jgi:thiamine-phosphate pyrophosphorylase
MIKKINDKEKIERLLDANLNRLKEGLRVLEDINRYIFNHQEYTSEIKLIRHKLQPFYNINRLTYRDIHLDIQKDSISSELNRTSIQDILIANFSRAQEASRVLEETYKLYDVKSSEVFKKIRYRLYHIEKNTFSTHYI